jgi:hypothetical protein
LIYSLSKIVKVYYFRTILTALGEEEGEEIGVVWGARSKVGGAGELWLGRVPQVR